MSNCFLASLLIAGKARSIVWCTTQVGSGLTCKYQTRQKRLNKHKGSSLFVLFINDEEESVYKIDYRSHS